MVHENESLAPKCLCSGSISAGLLVQVWGSALVLFPVMCQPCDADCQPDCSCDVYHGGNDCNYTGACVNVFN